MAPFLEGGRGLTNEIFCLPDRNTAILLARSRLGQIAANPLGCVPHSYGSLGSDAFLPQAVVCLRENRHGD